MIIRYFNPGMVVEMGFLMPGGTFPRPKARLCLVMSVHLKGLLVHPFMPKGTSAEEHAVYTSQGRVACDLRNVNESPTSYAVPHAMRGGVPDFARARLEEQEFSLVRAKSLDCAYNGLMKSERLKSERSPVGRRHLA